MGVPSGAGAVMSSRFEPADSLDFFPTPPWATRALLHHIIAGSCSEPMRTMTAWDPACGEGHMSEVLAEEFSDVLATDVFDYGRGYPVRDFMVDFAGVQPHWIITNPPFRLALNFAERALMEARVGVAFLVRTAWLEGGDRYRELFSFQPPAIIGQFAERVPMTKGRWDPDASTATSYCWVVWRKGFTGTRFMWIPPGQRKALTKPTDAARFATSEVTT